MVHQQHRRQVVVVGLSWLFIYEGKEHLRPPFLAFPLPPTTRRSIINQTRNLQLWPFIHCLWPTGGLLLRKHHLIVFLEVTQIALFPRGWMAWGRSLSKEYVKVLLCTAQIICPLWLHFYVGVIVLFNTFGKCVILSLCVGHFLQNNFYAKLIHIIGPVQLNPHLVGLEKWRSISRNTWLRRKMKMLCKYWPELIRRGIRMLIWWGRWRRQNNCTSVQLSCIPQKYFLSLLKHFLLETLSKSNRAIISMCDTRPPYSNEDSSTLQRNSASSRKAEKTVCLSFSWMWKGSIPHLFIVRHHNGAASAKWTFLGRFWFLEFTLKLC